MITTSDKSIKSILNLANPSVLADLLRKIKVGDVLRSMNASLFSKLPAADGSQLAVLFAIVLPEDAKALHIVRAYAKTGTAGVGELTVVAYGVTPASGEIAVAPNGDIVTLAADALTSVDLTYTPAVQDVKEMLLPVAAGVLLLPAGVLSVLEATVTKVSAGLATGKKVVLVPGAAPAAGEAALTLAKDEVLFAVADNATEALVKVGVVPATDVNVLLETESTFA